MDKKELGIWGEELAKEYLIQLGFEILDTNWRSSYWELDLVVRINNTIVFVEVKTRITQDENAAIEAVNLVKMNRLAKAASAYLERFEEDIEARFDIISIIKSDQVHIRHIENAFDMLGLSE